MKVRICYTVEVDDRYRRAINRHFGRDGLATRAEVQRFLRQYGGSIDSQIVSEMDDDESEEEANG